MSVGLMPDALMQQAMEKTGLDDLGSDHFRHFLAAWCTDLASDRLSDTGRAFLARQAVRNLETRLWVHDVLRRHPEIEDVPVPRIVRIMGFARSGTTLLHNLMALRSGARSLLRWELVEPVPPPDAATAENDPRIGKVQRSLEALRGGDLERLHWVEATDPEECTWGFIDVSGLMGRGCAGVMDHWSDAIYDTNRTYRETYEEYRRLVQLLLWRNPVPPGGVLVLKCPSDVGQLLTFLDVFPEAQVVLCHRDPFRTLTSTCRVIEVVSRPFVVDPRPLAEGDGAGTARNLANQVRFAEAMLVAAEVASDRLTSVRYQDLMSDPAGVVVGAFETLSMDPQPADTAAAIERFLAAQRAGRRAAPPPDYGTYGYSPDQVRGHPSMARYMRAFDVEPEHVRVSEPTARG